MKLKHLLILFSISLFSCHKKTILPLQKTASIDYERRWTQLKSYPETTGRNDDLYFITPQKGWVINNQGRLYHTNDGGKTWELQFEKEDSFFRAIVFADSLNGWLGTIGLDDHYLYSSDSIILYETHDGGKNWQPTTIQGDYPTGICGLQKVTDNFIVGCGRVRGPAHFLKTIDKGKNWTSVDLSEQVGALIVPHFFDEQNGLLIGGSTRDKKTSHAMVLSTNDGGSTWNEVFRSSQAGEYCWKIVFPTEQIGYISVQRNIDEGNFYFLKTVDGGRNWKEQKYADKHYFTQGIGFINKDIGWIGGSSSYGTYETQDGGQTWSKVTVGKGINKFQFFGDSLGYVAGGRLYKIEKKPLLVQ